MRLIDADDLIERINVVIEHGLADPDGLHPVSAEVVLETINVIPSAQPEIVRCKDCKYWKRSSCCEGYCGEIDMEGFDEDHYCGFAERKQDG